MPEGPTILVVDDDPSVRRVVGMVLERHGFQVLEAAGGQAALDELERHGDRVALVILDVVMPDLSGQAVFAALRQRWPAPVLFHSGFRGNEALTHELEQPAVAFLQKPWSMRQLMAAVRRLLP